MAQDTSGIMGLQEDYFSKGMLPPEMGVEVADGTLQGLDPQLSRSMDEMATKVGEGLANITDEQLDMFIQLVQRLFDEPENYAENRAELIKNGGLTEADIPAQYDPDALSMMLYALRKEQMSRQRNMMPGQGDTPPMPMAGAAPQMMQPPQGFARGGIAEAARIVAGSGRNGDTMLAHITPREAKLLRKHGGSGTINPKTGLPEYAWYSFLVDAWHGVWRGVVKPFLQSSVGKIISKIALNVLLPGWGAVIDAGLQSAANGGDFGDIVKSMAISTAVSFVSGSLPGVESPIKGVTDSLAGNFGITSEVGKQAFREGLVNTGAGLLQGQDLKDAATSGLMAAGTVMASDFLKSKTDANGNPAPVEERGTLPADGRSRTLGADADIPMPSAEVSSVLNKPQPYVGSLEGIDTAYQGKLAGVDYPYGGKPAGGPVTEADLLASRSTTAPPVNTGSSTNVQSGANAAGTTGFKPVSVKDAFSTMGEGTKQMFTGDVSGGFDKLTQGAGDLFFPSSPSATDITNSADYKSLISQNISPDKAYELAAKKLEPGMLRTYGPGAAAGLGIMAMAGGFSPPDQGGNPNGPQFRGPTGEDLIKQNPSKYLVQGLPGVNYDAQGNIIGNKEQYPYYRMPDIQVASNYGGAPRFADGGIVRLARGGPANGAGYAGFGMDPESPQMVEYRAMAQSLTPAARQYMASRNNNGAIADMNMMREAMAYSAREEARRAPAQENALYAADPERYRPNMTQPVQLASGGSPQDIARMMEAGRQRAMLQHQGVPKYNSNIPAPVAVPPVSERPITTMPITPPPGSGPTPVPPGMRGPGIFREPIPRIPTSGPYVSDRPPSMPDERVRTTLPYRSKPLRTMNESGSGIAGLAMGGYPRKTGQISGPGTETSDSIPAMLSDGEFVMTAKAVRGLGQGSRREGAKKMYALMHQLERNAARG